MPPELVTLLISVLGAGASSLGVFEAVQAWLRRSVSAKADLTLNKQELDIAMITLREELSQAPGPGGGGTKGGGGGAPTVTETPTPAELEALAILQVYSKELLAEANRIAKRANAERPSKKHVRQAADRIGVLRDRAGVASDLALAIGSILIGGAISFQINIWTGGHAHDGMGLWMALVLAVGVGVTVAAAIIKWRRS